MKKIYLSFVFVNLQNILLKRKIIRRKFGIIKIAFIKVNHSKYSMILMYLNHIFDERGNKHIVEFHIFIFKDIL